MKRASRIKIFSYNFNVESITYGSLLVIVTDTFIRNYYKRFHSILY